MTPIESLVMAGTKVWLDSVDPDEVAKNRAWGITGATSNPIIVADLIQTGRFDQALRDLLGKHTDEEIAWLLTDSLVSQAQKVFQPVWDDTACNDGWVSFELDPLLEDPANTMSVAAKTARYIELGRQWSHDKLNRMIKIPATEGGLGALEELVAAGVAINVTLIFSERQYEIARDACWRGAQRRGTHLPYKTVYSIFVSRVDVYTEKHVPTLSPAAQGIVGIVNAKRIWAMNQHFWSDKHPRLEQELIFASTGVKKAGDPPWKYVEAFAGSDIETNPPKTNADIQASGRMYERHVDEMPTPEILAEIDEKVDNAKMEEVLMHEGLQKFADPQKALIALVKKKRGEV